MHAFTYIFTNRICPMAVDRWLSASRPADAWLLLSLILWFVSLLLPALMFHGDVTWRGYDVLLLGWFPASGGNLAWFANPIYLLAVLKRREVYKSAGLSLLGTIVALDMFRFSGAVLDPEDSDRVSAVFGYGWGCVVWGLAFGVLLISVGVRVRSASTLQSGPRFVVARGLAPLGCVLAIAILGAALLLARRDHAKANLDDGARLKELAFARDPVCQTNVARVDYPLGATAGPLELQTTGAWSPMDDEGPLTLLALLDWGIETVRFRGMDYVYTAGRPPLPNPMPGPPQLREWWGNGNRPLASRPATGPASERLVVDVETSGSGRKITMDLAEVATSRVIFHQVWHEERVASSFCPDYTFSNARNIFPPRPALGDQPRALIMHALGR